MAEVTLHFPPAKGVIVTSRLATDRLPQKHGPHRRNERVKERGRERDREGREVTDRQDHPPDPITVEIYVTFLFFQRAYVP